LAHEIFFLFRPIFIERKERERIEMGGAMSKKTVYLAFFVLINLSFLLTPYEGQTQPFISLPWTGQSKCYNEMGAEISCAGTGQDGELQVGIDWPDPRFTVSGDCVTDNLTGLMWAKNGNLPNGTKTWQGALDYVASMNSGSGLCGHKDWRLPNVNELESLINSGEANTGTWLKGQGFSNVLSYHYWSSTSSALYTAVAWIVGVCSGGVYYHDMSYSFYCVWPVRLGQVNNSDPLYPANVWKTGQTTKYSTGDDGDLEKGVVWPSPRFTDHGNGTITDNLTGLMWTKNADLAGGPKTWQGALDYVKTLNIGGYSDWRLPNRKDLFSLIDHSKWGPALPASHPFQNVQSYYYWSSTTSAIITASAWLVHMWLGYVDFSTKSYYYLYVWPVRSGQGPLGYPDISVTPNPVEFGSVNVGATSEKQVIVKNDGNANLVIGTITSPTSPFSKATDNCSGQTIAPNATCTVMYRFTPTTSGNFSSNSNIPSNDPDENPVTVTLNGTGSTAPSLTVSKSGAGTGTVTSSPAGINCGDDCSEVYTQGTKVTLTAKADVNSTFSGWSGGGCTGTKTCTVIVDSEITVTASFALKTPDMSVSPGSLDFGSVKSGKKTTKTLKITNNGSGDLVITFSGLEDTEFSIQGSGSVTIKAKKSYSLKVLCTPTSGGLKTATLEIDSNDPDTPTLDISLTATLPATTPDISVAQTSIEFGSVKVGKKTTKTLKIANNGSGDLVITLSGLEGTEFSIQGSSSVTIKGKKSYSLKVLFTPTSAELKTATLEITSNDPDTPVLDRSLSGTGL
jgi:hypothetical protein